MLGVLAGCGGDDEEASTTPAESATTESGPTQTDEQPPRTETGAEAEGGGEGESGDGGGEAESGEGGAEAESPEDRPGGAGDEEPARTLALFTGRGGRIAPRVIRVPAFISVRVELRSADGAVYSLRFGKDTISAGERLNSHSMTIDGLRPGEAVTGKPSRAGNPVRIEATAEPGP